MKKLKVLNLYAGIGGNRKHWEDVEVTAIEYEPKIAAIYKEFFPNDTVIIADAHQYLLDHYREFDFIWSSPPCQTHSRLNIATRHDLRRYADMSLYQEILFLKTFSNALFLFENVIPYYKPLIEPTYKIGRHLFWCNFTIESFKIPKNIKNFIGMSTKPKEQILKDFLGMNYKGTVYYGNNHCPVQVLRNCVHPDIGLAILNSARGIITDNNIKPGLLF